MEENNDSKMPITRRGLILMAGGVLVMALGYILLSGGGSDDPPCSTPRCSISGGFISPPS